MKYLNIAFVALFAFCMISCGGEKTKTTHITDSESMEIDDEDELLEDDIDETDFIEAAMAALDAGDTKLAVEEIMNAVTTINSYIGEMDDPSEAKDAVTQLTKLVTSIKNGTAMSSEDLEKAVLSIRLFSDDELELEEEIIE
ncbi:MAG: methionyl-tRNA synthetase [Saprospiraceae bacterium]|jgi:methionyl-tRNA synthetase|tara:strand:+ start:502 stop:927 length:426 start_codon:yes stop_codon:yes gene_type:complete